MTKLLCLAFVTLTSIAILGVEGNLRLAEGKECLHQSGVVGICTTISNCPGESENIFMNRSSSAVCSFKDKVAIICCTAGRPGVKSVKACKELKDMVPHLSTGSISNGILPRKKFPHMALLGFDVEEILEEDEGPWKCAGSLVSDQFVLTAAHCIVTRFGNVTKIKLGAQNWRQPDGNEQDFEIEQIFQHPDYKPSAWYDDIALIKLKGKAVITGNIYPACLYTQSKEPKSLIVSGWGKTNPNSRAFNDVLLEGKNELKPVESRSCTSRYRRLGSMEKSIPNGVNSKMFCASDNTETTDLSTDTCQGDSGGPIQLRFISPMDMDVVTYEVVGVTSGGPLCGGEPPGIYTRVYYYLDWIEKIIYPN